ncbi:MAG: FG-GAP-like repeat-containing protein [Bacteroidales bacterium]
MKAKLILFLFVCQILFVLSQANAQQNPHWIDSTLTHNELNAIAVGDLDGDGDVDVVSGHDNGVYWHENDGNGHFSPRQKITKQAEYSYVTAIEVADLNSDGKPDIVFSSIRYPVAWIKNFGDGHFSGINSLLDGELKGMQILISDIDNDNHKDIIASINRKEWPFYKGIITLRNQGDGNFDNPVQLKMPTEYYFYSLHVADFNGDNYDDIEYLYDGKMVIHINDGNGIFKNYQKIPISDVRFNLAADINHDGIDDFVFYDYKNHTLSWNENTGLPGLGPENLISSPAYHVDDISFCDMDGDGIKDLLLPFNTIGYSPNMGWNVRVGWLKNDGKGNFDRPVFLGDRIHRRTPEEIYAADMDSDGDLDAVVSLASSHFYDGIVWYENQLAENNKLNVFPNPTDGQVTISTVDEMKMIKVFDAYGQELQRLSDIKGKRQTLNLSLYATGIYIIIVYAGQEELSAKVVRRK